MTPTEAREQACTAFLEPLPIAYIRVEYIDGKRTCILHDDMGEAFLLSECGMSPLFSYAANRGIEILTVH